VVAHVAARPSPSAVSLTAPTCLAFTHLLASGVDVRLILSPPTPSSSPRGRPDRTATREFRLFNTPTRHEPFAPSDGTTVRIYSCGPTVYNPAHLGNFRTFLFVDLLRRTLRLRGWIPRQVMNLTDVDDKIIKRAAEQGKTIAQVTEPVTKIFQEDREYCASRPPRSIPRRPITSRR
jgi:hypothetical protein